MRAIAEPKRYGAAAHGWKVAADARAPEPTTPAQTGWVQPVMESCGEQPWAEFCSGLDQPAFLLPVTGFSEL